MELLKVLKANPYHGEDGQFTTKDKATTVSEPSSEGSVSVKPAFAKGKKLNISDAAKALEKQGIKMEPAPMGPGFTARYKLTNSKGVSQTISAKDLTKLLTKKDES